MCCNRVWHMIRPLSKPIDSVKAGEVLFADISDERGILLLPKGKAVSARELELLKKKGIGVLVVENREDTNTGEDESKERAMLARMVEQKFAIHKDSEYMMQVAKIVLQYHMSKPL